MFFEGAEKKVEVLIHPSHPSLRDINKEFWEKIVGLAKASILSHIENLHCVAYLLSESSLFVFDHKFIMITCGQTTLIEAIFGFFEKIPTSAIEMLVYQRKNEVLPQRQLSSFMEDAQALNRLFPGKAFQFGKEDEHHLVLYHLDRNCTTDPKDITLEILMYGIEDFFNKRDQDFIKKSFAAIFPDFIIDDYHFTPMGYSLNAIKEAKYFTIHITPQKFGSYVSFESNCYFGKNINLVVEKITALFKPQSFDVVLFEQNTKNVIQKPGYKLKTKVLQQLTCGYLVSFMNYYQPFVKEKAMQLPLEILKEKQ